MRRLLILLCCSSLLFVAGACGKKKKKKGKKAEAEAAAATAAARSKVKEFVSIELDEDGFSPNRIPAAKGKPITLTFTRTDSDACPTVVFASENLRKDLPVDKPVQVLILPGVNGKIHFSCPSGSPGGDLDVQ